MTITAPHLGRMFSRRNRPGWIGVDVGTVTLKLAKVERRGGQWQLCFGQVLPITPGAVSSVEGLRQTLKESIQCGGGWRRQPAACLLPWSLTDLRTTELPPAADDELAQLVAAETSDTVSGPEDCQVAHWRAGEATAAAQPSPVHIVSIPTTTASAAVGSLAAAKLDCYAIDARPFALARAVAMSPIAESAKTVAAVDWGFDQVTVVLVRDGLPYFTRSLPDDGLRFVLENLQHGLKLSYDEACALLRRFTLQATARNSSSNDDITKALHNLTREPIDRTTNELERTLSFAAQEHADLTSEQVMLFGGGATVQGVDRLLTKRLGIPTEIWRLDAGTATSSDALFGEAIALSAIPLWP